MNTGTKFLAVPCPYIPPIFQASDAAPSDSVLVDDGTYGPLNGSEPMGACFNINNLRACSYQYPYGVLTLAVHVPGRRSPVAVQIGLAGNGMTARTILYSMRAAA